MKELILENELSRVLSVSGHPAWSFLKISDHEFVAAPEIKTFFLQEMFDRSILCLGSHLISFAHTQEDIDQMIDAYRAFLPRLKKGLEDKTLKDMLRCDVLRPLFSVRKT